MKINNKCFLKYVMVLMLCITSAKAISVVKSKMQNCKLLTLTINKPPVSDSYDIIMYWRTVNSSTLDYYSNEVITPVHLNENLVFQIFSDKLNNGYFYFAKKQRKDTLIRQYEGLSCDYYFEAGDKVEVLMTNNNRNKFIFPSLKFMGINTAKYNAVFQADSIKKSLHVDIGSGKFNQDGYSDPLSNEINASLKAIENNRQMMSADAYNLIKANAYFTHYLINEYTFTAYYDKVISLQGQSYINHFIAGAKAYFHEKEKIDIPSNILADSHEYIGYLLSKINTLTYLNYGKQNEEIVLEEILRNYNGRVRDQLILKMFQRWQLPKSVSAKYSYLCSIMQDELSIKAFKKLSDIYLNTTLDLELPDLNGIKHNLKQYLNKVVVLNFWFSGCAPCIWTYKNVLSPVQQKYLNNKEVVFMSVSMDKDKSKWINSVMSNVYTSASNTINLYTEGKGMKHPFLKKYSDMGYPFIILIDKSGKIKHLNEPELHKLVELDTYVQQLLEN